MRLLVDTNIFLEVLLAQKRADEAKLFLGNAAQHELFISDFSLHSIGLLLLNRKKDNAFLKFLNDMILGAGTHMASLAAHELDAVVAFANTFNLDFDDGYQYAIAEKLDLVIVTFDADFDRTTRGRTEPGPVT